VLAHALALFSGFPREIGKNRKVVKNKSDFVRFVNSHNGKQSIYSTVYAFVDLKKPWRCDYETAIVDKLFFDFDTEHAYEDVVKLHAYCMERNLYHRAQFSGGGYQFFIFTDPAPLKDKKGALYNAQRSFEKQVGIECDAHVMGDVARICRITNTYNIKRRKWCIPLTRDMIKMGDEKIREMADSQIQVPLDSWLLGGPALFNIEIFDGEKKIDLKLPDGLEYSNEVSEDISIQIGCKALKRLLKNPNMGYRHRYHLILYLREKGYTPTEVIRFLKEVLTKKKFNHCIFEERAVEYIFRRQDLMMANKGTLEREGICFNNCDTCDLDDLYYDA